MITQYLLDFILSFIAFFFCFYFPASLILKKFKLSLSPLEHHIFSIASGFVGFTLLAFILDTLKVFYLIFPILILLNILAVKNISFKKIDISFVKTKSFLLLLSFCFIFSFVMLINIDTGSKMWISIDAPWHFSLISSLMNSFPPVHPNMSGVAMMPYHYFADYVIAKTLNIFPISLSFAYFYFFPFLTAVLWVFGVYLFMQRWLKNNIISLLSVIFTLFAGSFSFIPFLFGHTDLSLNSSFGMLQPDLSLINPPFAMSLVILIFGLFSTLLYIQTKKKEVLIYIAIFAGIAAMFKVYAGMLLFAGLFVFLITRLFKKDFKFIFAIIGMIIVFYITYWSSVGKSGFLFPAIFWAPHDVFNSNFPFFSYSGRIAIYTEQSNLLKIFLLESFVLTVYTLGNIGTRVIGLILIFFQKEKKKIFISEMGLILVSMTLFSFFLPLLFLQSIKPFEITQMFNYFLFLLSIINCIGLGLFFQKIKNRKLLIVLVILILVPTLVSTVTDIYAFTIKRAPIQGQSYNAYKFLKNVGSYKDAVVEIPNWNTISPQSWASNGFLANLNVDLSAFSYKSTYLTNGPIQFPKDELEKRLSVIASISKLSNQKMDENTKEQLLSLVNEQLRKKGVKYIYTLDLKNNLSKLPNLKLIYNKEGITIYEII